MKAAFFLLALLTALISNAQQLIEVNGMYCTANGQVFTGEYTTYYPHGEKAATYSIQAGHLHKNVTYFRENGSVEMTGSFHKGRKDGIWRSHDEQGKLVAEARFKKGERIGEWIIKDPYTNNAFMLYYAKDRLINSRQVNKGELPVVSYR
jgi:hypothetical protein